MKRIASIMFIIVLLASTLHVTMASHYCSGALVQVALLPSHMPGGCCDIEIVEDGIPALQPTCCENAVTVWSTDTEYTASSQPATVNPIQQTAFVAAHPLLTVISQAEKTTAQDVPPNDLPANRVERSRICVYRI